MSLADRHASVDPVWLQRAYRALGFAIPFEVAMADSMKERLIHNHALELIKASKRRRARFDPKLAQLGEAQPEVD